MVYGGQGAPKGSKMEIEGVNVLPCPRGSWMGATLDASIKFKKSGGLRWHLKVV